MQKFRPDSVNKICLTLLSLTLLTQTVFGYEEDKVSYLDSISSSYMYNMPESTTSSLLNMNSEEARGVEATFRLDSAPPITNSKAKVNLSLRDSDLRQALRMIADKGGLNIVFDKSIEGKITLDLNNVTVNEAFMIIFKSNQLTYALDGNTITVMTLEAAKKVGYSRQNMTVIPIKYVNTESVAAFLNTNLFTSNIFGLSNRPIVTANPRTNQIIVFGTQADVNAIKRILPMIDTKPMVNSFKVNHTTPEEMATLLCDALFETSESSSSSSSSSSSDSEDRISLGGGKIACRDQAVSFANNDGLMPFKNPALTIAYFPELGKINTYGGSVEQVEVIKDFIKQHDIKQLMAYLELSVIELNETGSKTFSNTWDLWTPFISLGFDTTAGLKTKAPFLMWDSRLPNNMSKTNNKALIYQLQYLIKNGNGRVLTNPKIMITSGKSATIDMTSDYIKSVTSQILQGSDTVTSATQKTYDIGTDEGLLIEIVPFISPDGYVSMNITPEFATVKSREYTKNEANEDELAVTLLQRRDLELKNIRIKDDETLVLAGLIKESETQTATKMPILSDLPFIGAFFRGSQTEKSREELVIVVTPHIIKDSEDVADEQIYDL